MSRDEPIEQERAETRQVERRDGTESPGETTSRDDRPGRQAGRDGRSDELMKTAREEINCHLPGIRPYQGVVGAVSFLVSPHRLVFRLVPCLLACRLRFISSSHLVSRYRLVLSVSLGVSCVSRPVVPRCLPPIMTEMGTDAMRRQDGRDDDRGENKGHDTMTI